MRMVTLGSTGLRVSEVGFGGIPIQRLSHEEAVAVVRGCLDLGVNLIDTAHGYTTSEERIGAAVAGRRHRVVLATKTHGQTGADARAHLELSLRRLGVDHIDLYQFHNVSSEEGWKAVTEPGGALEVIQQAQREGTVGHIGVTSHRAEIAIEAVQSGYFETILFPFNFVANEPGLEVLEACRRAGVAFLAMKPMGGGLLENARIAFRYLRQFPDVIPVVGIERVSEMAEIAALYRLPPSLADEERAEMARIAQELGTIFCRRCEYCQPCRTGISISTVMNVPAFLKRMPPDRTFGEGEFGKAIALVDDCEDCGDCESRCPYHLPIRERMAEMVTIYRQARAEYLASRPS